MPEKCLTAMREAFREGEAPFDEAALEPVVFGVLRRMTPAELSRLPDLSEGLENRIYAAIRQAAGLGEVHTLAKSKRYTAARIRRVVTSAFLGLDDSYGAGDTGAPYLRILGFNERGREILTRMKQTARLPVSDSLAYLRRLGGRAAAFAELEARSTDLYRLGLAPAASTSRRRAYGFFEPPSRAACTIGQTKPYEMSERENLLWILF